MRTAILVAPVVALISSLAILAPVLASQIAELPDWQLALMFSSDAAVVCSYLLLLLRRRGEGPTGQESPARPPIGVRLVLLALMFGPDVGITAWLGVEDVRAHQRSVEAQGMVVRIEDAGNKQMRIAHYVFNDREGVPRTGTLRMSRIQRNTSIDMDLLAALNGPVPFAAGLRYDPVHPEHSWLLGQDQRFDSLHEMSTAILILQILLVAIASLAPEPAVLRKNNLSHSEFVRATPFFVLTGVYFLQAFH